MKNPVKLQLKKNNAKNLWAVNLYVDRLLDLALSVFKLCKCACRYHYQFYFKPDIQFQGERSDY